MPDTVKIQYQTSLKFVSRFLMKSGGKSGRIYHRRLPSPVTSKEILGLALTGCNCASMFVFFTTGRVREGLLIFLTIYTRTYIYRGKFNKV